MISRPEHPTYKDPSMSATVADEKTTDTTTTKTSEAPKRRRRGRPKLSEEEKAQRAAERECLGYYEKPFGGRVKFLVGIMSHGPSGQPYAHHCCVGGVQFQRISQEQYARTEDDGWWVRLAEPGRVGKVVPLTFGEITRFRERVVNYVVKGRYSTEEGQSIRLDDKGIPTARATAFNIVDLSSRVGHVNPATGKSEEGPYLYHRLDIDIPVAKCLVLLKVSDARDFGRTYRKLPTVADLQPSLALIPDSFGAGYEPEVEEEYDEDWT